MDFYLELHVFGAVPVRRKSMKFLTKAGSRGNEKLKRKWPKSVFLGGGTKNMVIVSLMGTVLFWHGFNNLSIRGRYKNEIVEWKGPPIFQNKRVRYARADELEELYSNNSATLPVTRRHQSTYIICRGFTLIHELSVGEHKHSPARMGYSEFVH